MFTLPESGKACGDLSAATGIDFLDNSTGALAISLTRLPTTHPCHACAKPASNDDPACDNFR